MTVSIELDKDNKLIVRFDYTTDRVEKIKSISERKYHTEEKYWTVPDNEKNLISLIHLFSDDKLKFDSKLIPKVEVICHFT